MSKKKTTEEFIQEAKLKHGDKYDYSKTEYINALTKTIFICKEHGEFLQKPSCHLQGNGCTDCSILKKNNNNRYTSEIFINKAKEIHGEIYDYSKVNYIDSKTKVIIICKEHGEFLQVPGKHLQKQGCYKCHCYQKFNNQEFIDRAKETHGNAYDYSKVEYINSQTKITIICNIHGEFSQIPNSHLQGMGCKLCGYESTSQKKTSNKDEFIEKARKVHGDLYDYSKVEYSNVHEKIKIICNKHGEFLQIPSNHLKGKGCPKCYGKNKTTLEFIDEANKVHNNLYDYSKAIYINATTKICITCKIHGEFEQLPNSHLNGIGCTDCSILKRTDNSRYTSEIFINKAKEIHGEIYDYSKVNYIDSKTKILITCKIHGDYYQSPQGHLGGKGCKLCGYESISQKKTSNKDEFIEKARKVHGDLYDYSKVEYKKANENIVITCKNHGDFEIRPNNHIGSIQGCPKCQNVKQYSTQQIQWLNFIQLKDNIKIQHAENSNEYKIPNTRFKADGYCVETNTVYEYHGDYWHGNPKKFNHESINKTTNCTFGELYQKTLEKEQQIRELGFNLITIWENDWIKLNKCVRILQEKYINSKLN